MKKLFRTPELFVKLMLAFGKAKITSTEEQEEDR